MTTRNVVGFVYLLVVLVFVVGPLLSFVAREIGQLYGEDNDRMPRGYLQHVIAGTIGICVIFVAVIFIVGSLLFLDWSLGG